MTEKERLELAEIVTVAVRREMQEQCALGIKPETAHELISFADSWKTYRKGFQVAMTGILVAGVASAIWAGIKTFFIHSSSN